MSIEAIAHYLIVPVHASLLLGLAALVAGLARWRRMARWLAVAALVLLWVCSTPWVAREMQDSLTTRYAPFAPQDAPAADAIVILGGAVTGSRPPLRPSIWLGPSGTRVWYAASLYRAGKAPRIMVAAGGRGTPDGEQVEADAIAELLAQWGVPASAITTERLSLTTRENARFVLPLLQAVGARKVLLVTSAEHMPRAVATFERVWEGRGPQVIPAPTGRPAWTDAPLWELCLPSLTGLLVVTNSLKEFAGMAALAIIR